MPLSPEQVRRLMLARAVAGQPRLLLIHEALDYLDSEISERVIAWILRPDAAWTAIIATQHPEVIGRCDVVWHLCARGAWPARGPGLGPGRWTCLIAREPA
jgi:ABC-type bacteriocin/lantibiotic exporter with double-glycine peptidase domain